MWPEPNDAGESVTAINRRSDDSVEPRILSALNRGAFLIVHRKINRAVVENVHEKDPDYGITISLTRVRNLEKQGHLKQIGIDKYAAAGVVARLFEKDGE